MSDPSDHPDPDTHVFPIPPLEIIAGGKGSPLAALQSTLFWGCFATIAAIVLTVVAAMIHDIRWLLFFAWPFAAFAAWEFARTCSNRRSIIWCVTCGAIVLAGAALGWLYFVLAPEPVKLTLPAPASEVQQAAPPAPTTTPTPPAARLSSTVDRMNYICDKPQRDQDDKAQIQQYLSVVAGAQGWTPKFTDIENGFRMEGELSHNSQMPIITTEIRRFHDQLFVTRIYVLMGNLRYSMGIPVEPNSPDVKTGISIIEDWVRASPGRCRLN